MITGMPPWRSTSFITYLPNGFMSAMCGVLSPMRLKSCRVELDLRLAGDREQVQHDVRRAAERHGEGDRVLERLLGEDVAAS